MGREFLFYQMKRVPEIDGSDGSIFNKFELYIINCSNLLNIIQ